MSQVSIYLNFPRNTKEAFNFYKEVFGGEFEGQVGRMGDVPPMDGQPALSQERQEPHNAHMSPYSW